MKAVVVEIRSNNASLLTDDGCVEIQKNKNYKIGQVIHMSKYKKFNIKKITAIVGSAAAFVLMGTGTWAYATPYSYVSVDVNPSIEYTVNRFDRVIHVKAVNADGTEILKDISLSELQNKSIDDAIEKTVEQITEAGYFDGSTEGGIVIATSSKDTEKADALAEELKATVNQKTTENGDVVQIETYSVGQERVAKARELGVTPGKLNLVEKLQAAAGDTAAIDTQEWLSKPVKDIMKETKKYKKANVAATIDDQDQEEKNDTATISSNNQDSNEDASDIENEDANDIEDNDAYESDDDDDSAREIAKEAAKHDKEQAKEVAKESREQAKKTAEAAKEKAKRIAEAAKEQAKEADEDSYEQDNNDNKNSYDQNEGADEDSYDQEDDSNKSYYKHDEESDRNSYDQEDDSDRNSYEQGEDD